MQDKRNAKKKANGKKEKGIPELGFYMLLGVVLLLLFSYLFYGTLWLSLPASPLLYPYYKEIKKRGEKKKRWELNLAFKDALLALTASLHAGYAIENAMREAYQEIVLLYGRDSCIAKEFMEMIRQMGIGKTIEEVFDDFAERSGLEDVRNFAQIFRIAKRSSGGLSAIMDSTAETIGEKIDVQREIRTMLQAKRFEQMIMNTIPLLIILYMRLGNGEFMEILYTSWMGRALMTGCLLVYAAAFWLAEKIISIRV